MKGAAMRILCSNDDGINSPGLLALEEIAKTLSDDVWTVAPEQDQSGMSRSITLTRPLRVRKVGHHRFAVDGTPTDSVTLGMMQLLKDNPPDLVLSGINRGQNIADDVSMSGTVAVAFQGMSLGVPSLALSQQRGEEGSIRWETAVAHCPKVIRVLLEKGWSRNVILNINFPDCPPEDVTGVDFVRQGRRDKTELIAEERTDLRGRRYYWFGFDDHVHDPAEGTDLYAIEQGRIAITPLHLNMTDIGALDQLAGLFD